MTGIGVAEEEEEGGNEEHQQTIQRQIGPASGVIATVSIVYMSSVKVMIRNDVTKMFSFLILGSRFL